MSSFRNYSCDSYDHGSYNYGSCDYRNEDERSCDSYDHGSYNYGSCDYRNEDERIGNYFLSLAYSGGNLGSALAAYGANQVIVSGRSSTADSLDSSDFDYIDEDPSIVSLSNHEDSNDLDKRRFLYELYVFFKWIMAVIAVILVIDFLQS